MTENIMCQMGDIVLGNVAFNNLRTQKLNVRASLQVNRISKAVEVEGEIFNIAHQEVIDRHAKMKDGERVVVNDSVVMKDREAFNAEFEELMGSAVDLRVHKLKLSWLSNLEMSANDIQLLMFMLEDDISEEENG